MSTSAERMRRLRKRRLDGEVVVPPMVLGPQIIATLETARRIADWHADDPEKLREAILEILATMRAFDVK